MHDLEHEDHRRTLHAEIQLEMARSLLGLIDVNEVLSETLRWMEAEYSSNTYHLLLTQEYSNHHHSIRPLTIKNPDHDLCSRAFIEGHLVVNRQGGRTEAAAPFRGKQGTYGVLYLLGESSEQEIDLDYLAALAEFGGAAFEIARLYEQSTVLVNELRTINELTKKLNRRLQLSELYQMANQEFTQIFKADYCCILIKDQERQRLIVKASNAEELVDEEFDVHYGFAGVICRSKDPVIISDYHYDKHVDSKLMEITNAKSLIGAPIIIGSETIGAVLLVHRKANFFTFDSFKLLQVLSGHVGLAVANARLHAEMRKMIITDQLTGLYVRNYLYEQVHIHQRKDYRGSLIVFDIDDFKLINDTHGHQVGDKVLIQVSRIVRNGIRDTDIAARWGGEEFAVYLPLMSEEQAYKVADRIRKQVEQDIVPKVTISSGIASWTRDDERVNFDLLFHHADLAMYEAKSAGKNLIRSSKKSS